MRRSRTFYYSVLLFLHWGTFCLIVTFASNFLLGRGFSNTFIGLLLGTGYALSALGQPLIAKLWQKTGIRVSTGIACMYALIALFSLVNILTKLPAVPLFIVTCLCVFLISALESSTNSVHGCITARYDCNYGVARGMGSASFAITAYFAGILLKNVSADILPKIYCAGSLAACLGFLFLRSDPAPKAEAAAGKQGGLLKRNPMFAVFLLGSVLFCFPLLLQENFLLQVMTSVGGNSVWQGRGILLIGLSEVPLMIFFEQLKKKFTLRFLISFCGVMMVVRILLLCLSRSPLAVTLTEALQMFTYAVYMPAAIALVYDTLPSSDALQGVALVASGFTAGSLAATFLGGMLIDAIGIRPSLWVSFAVACAGAALFMLSVKDLKKQPE